MVDLAEWVAGLDALVRLIAGRFGRVEPRRRAGSYPRGLLAGLDRKNGWTPAEVVALRPVRALHGTGKRRSPSGRNWRDCRRCGGRGRRIRTGRRLYKAVAGLTDRGTR